MDIFARKCTQEGEHPRERLRCREIPSLEMVLFRHEFWARDGKLCPSMKDFAGLERRDQCEIADRGVLEE